MIKPNEEQRELREKIAFLIEAAQSGSLTMGDFKADLCGKIAHAFAEALAAREAKPAQDSGKGIPEPFDRSRQERRDATSPNNPAEPPAGDYMNPENFIDDSRSLTGKSAGEDWAAKTAVAILGEQTDWAAQVIRTAADREFNALLKRASALWRRKT